MPVNVGLADIANVVPVPVWEAMEVALPTDVMGPVKLALVVTFPAVKPAAVPVTLVITPDAGVPRAGAMKAMPEGVTTVPVKVGEARLALRLRAVC